ncbi:MAG: GNAT family N-acetyltransferase [Chloroflexales bacterium]|nr:GNAT family N-acetyltransferase [Chloroflexales bacterium]
MRLEGDTLIVRPLAEAELPTLLKIYQGTPLYFEALGIKPNSLTLDDVRAQWQAAQSASERLLLGVEVPAVDLLIGVVDVQLHYPEPGITTFWLLLIWGGFQRQGYGQEVTALVADWLIVEGITELRVVAADNEEGLNFWQLRGFSPSGEMTTAPLRNAPARWLVRDSRELRIES